MIMFVHLQHHSVPSRDYTAHPQKNTNKQFRQQITLPASQHHPTCVITLFGPPGNDIPCSIISKSTEQQYNLSGFLAETESHSSNYTYPSSWNHLDCMICPLFREKHKKFLKKVEGKYGFHCDSFPACRLFAQWLLVLSPARLSHPRAFGRLQTVKPALFFAKEQDSRMQGKEYQIASLRAASIIFCSLPQYLPLMHPSGLPGRISSIFLQCLPCSRTNLQISRSSWSWKSSFLMLGRRQLRNRSRICLGVNSIQWGRYLAFWNLLISTSTRTCAHRPPAAPPRRQTSSCPSCSSRCVCSGCSTCFASFPRSVRAGLSIITSEPPPIQTAGGPPPQTSASSYAASSQNALSSVFPLSFAKQARSAPFKSLFRRSRASSLQMRGWGVARGGGSSCRAGRRVRGRRNWERRGWRSQKSSLLLYA